MGDKPVDGEKSQPSLELPSLFGGRKKSRVRRKARREPSREDAAATAVPGGTAAGSAATDVEESPPAVPVEPVTSEAPPVEAAPVEAPVAAEPPPVERAETGPAPTAPPPAPAPGGAEPTSAGSTQARLAPPERTSVETEPVDGGIAEPHAGEAEPAASDVAPAESAPRRRARPRRALPTVSGRVAAPITGVLVGLFGAGLTYASLGACDAIRGTTSCGGPGLFVLVAIVVLMIVFGALLLRLFKVPDPRSTSFLAVGVTVVVVLVTLMQALFSSWMFLVVPVISAVAYSLAHWVTTRYVELPDDGPQHDIR